MLGIAVYAGVIAYGRVSKSFGAMPWIILLALAVATSTLSLAIMGTPLGVAPIALTSAIEFAILAVLYVLGVLLGRWLDRDKDVE